MTTALMPATRPWRLSGFTRKAVLVVHIISAVSWLGIDIVLGVFVLMASFSSDLTVAAVSYQAMHIFVLWTLIPAGLICLATGLLLGWGSKYGVMKYWWVAVKLALNIVLTALVPIALLPTVNDAAEYGRQLAAGDVTIDPPSQIFFPPIVSPIALTIAVILSVYKPWGRIRKRRTKTNAQ
ncbi:MAG: DUF2269 family protein [Sciscionella sp.]